MYKKNTISIFLLCLVAMPSLFSVYTIIEKKIIEHRMQEKLEQENLQTITLETSSIIWLIKNREILVNGEPFDIKSITRTGNKITFSGLFDLQEKILKEQLEAYNHSEEKPSAASNSLLLLLFTTYYQCAEPINLNTPCFIHKKPVRQKRQDKICNLYSEIIVPPPRSV